MIDDNLDCIKDIETFQLFHYSEFLRATPHTAILINLPLLHDFVSPRSIMTSRHSFICPLFSFI